MDKELCNYHTKINIDVKDYLNINNEKFYKKKFTYLTLRNSNFNDTSFRNCDIIACKFSDSKFRNIDLSNADLISIQVCNCIFENTIFDGTCIDDIEFSNCKFYNCSFKNFTMKNCKFINCDFKEFNPSCCLVELCNYFMCSFADSNFTSSFHYQIFDNCKFIRSNIDKELVGYNYGLSNFENQLNTKDKERYFEDLYYNYLNEKLYINALILKINYEYENNPAVILLWIDFLEIILKNNIIIKSNEILFLKNVINYFSNTQKISPLLIFTLNKKIVELYNTYCTKDSKIKEDIVLLINSLYFEFQKKLQNFTNENTITYNTNENLIIEINYLEKPKKDLSSILNSFGIGYCKQIKSKKGSFHEWISCPANMVICLEIFLMLLDITIPIVYDAIKEKRKAKSKRDSNILNLSEHPQNNVTINITVNNGCQILNDSNFIQNNCYGYNNKNVQKIKISYDK